MDRKPSPHALGATLYMPANRSDLKDILLGQKVPDLRSIVLCLEDALAERDVAWGLNNLRAVLCALERHDPLTPRPLVFVRPRSLEMARRLVGWPGIEMIDGLVVPKFRTAQADCWLHLVRGTRLTLMPTIETAEMFDPIAVRDLRDTLVAHDRSRILALRVGGNDLMACLALRRVRGRTLYDGPLVSLMSTLTGFLTPAGFSLTAPVFEILDDAATFAEELHRDVAFGFVGKTAIHPAQIPAIHAAFRVDPDDLAAALSILDGRAPAVFLHNGAMCEPATHRPWANKIVERARHFGLATQVDDMKTRRDGPRAA